MGEQGMTVRLLVYLVMSLAYMFSALAACKLIRENPGSSWTWIAGIPPLALTAALLTLVGKDLFS